MEGQKVQVEGGELLLMSDEGHFAVIPSKYRKEVMDMIEEGCNECLNRFISDLPKIEECEDE